MQPINKQNYQGQEEEDEQIEVFAEDHPQSTDDLFFDKVVNALQEIIMDEKFDEIQNSFMKSNCKMFEDDEENKMEYMAIFKQYLEKVEKYIEESLTATVPNFQMPPFLNLLQTRTEQIDEQLLEMLHSFTDFQVFKKLILEYKAYFLQELKLNDFAIIGNTIDRKTNQK